MKTAGTPTFEALDTPHFLDDFLSNVSTSGIGDRISLTTMSMDPLEEPVHELLDELQGAASRGAEVTFCVDAYTFMLKTSPPIPGPLVIPRIEPKARGVFAVRYDALEDMVRAGCNTSVVNKPKRPFTSPFHGRCHMKIGAINDRNYVIGPNLDGIINRGDLSVAWDDSAGASVLHGVASALAETRDARRVFAGVDRRLQFNGYELLFDAGVPGRSLIYDAAELAIKASNERAYFSSQFFPGGTIARELDDAITRGVDVCIGTNRPSAHGVALRAWQAVSRMRERQHLSPAFFERAVYPDGEANHVAIVATEDTVIKSSSTFHPLGVRMGTAEVALRIDNSDIARMIGSAAAAAMRVASGTSV